MQYRILSIVIVLVVLAFLPACQSANQEYLKNFEVVWQTVNDTFPDPTFGGVESHMATVALKRPGGHAVVRVEDEVDVTNGVGI